MGTTYQHKPEGVSALEMLKRELNPDCEIVAASVQSSTAYLAIKVKSTGDVIASVVKIHSDKKSACNFGTKWIDEDMGPYYWNCPVKVLDALTPTTNEHALAWRAKCRARIEKTKSLKAADLTGKTFKLWGRTYNVDGKSGKNWTAICVENHARYKITPRALMSAVFE